MNSEPAFILRSGCDILAPIMTLHGFSLRLDEEGSSSGGHFARASYLKGDWRLELHFRHSLGLVGYRLGDEALDHPTYMWIVLGKQGGNQYPGFSDLPLDAFRHLAHDLEKYASEFLRGDAEAFRHLVRLAKERPLPKGLQAIAPERQEKAPKLKDELGNDPTRPSPPPTRKGKHEKSD